MSDEQKVWGIDVSPTRIAVAVYSESGVRWAQTNPLNRGQQYEAVRDALMAASREHGEPTDVCIEQPALPFARAAYMAGAVCARTEDAVLGRWPHVVIRWMQPSEWRRIAGLGGRASKQEVFDWSVGMEFNPADQDQADASAIAYARYIEMMDEE